MWIMTNLNDKVYTPDFIVDEVLSVFMPIVGVEQKILEPFYGGGAFYKKLPVGRTDWCEIDMGVDFLQQKGFYDWVITNPPYSTFDLMLEPILKICNDAVLVIPVNKVLSSMPRLMTIDKLGFGIKRIHYLGSGRQLKFPFGFPVAAVHISRGWSTSTEISYASRCYDAKTRKTM